MTKSKVARCMPGGPKAKSASGMPIHKKGGQGKTTGAKLKDEEIE